MNIFFKRGITIFETLIVLAILGILFSVTIPQFSKIRENQALKNTIGDITSMLHKAQSQSMASFNSSEYGVHFQSNQIVLFKGKIYSEGAVDNNITDIILPASISNVTLGGVSSTSGDLYFERLLGIPSKTGSITILISFVSKIITISATGAISIN